MLSRRAFSLIVVALEVFVVFCFRGALGSGTAVLGRDCRRLCGIFVAGLARRFPRSSSASAGVAFLVSELELARGTHTRVDRVWGRVD